MPGVGPGSLPMRCVQCGSLKDKVLDSRSSKDGTSIRRRRECLNCTYRYTTYEQIERTELRVVKRDGTREALNREKLMSGLIKACEKRPVPIKTLELVADRVEAMVHENPDREVPTVEVGEFLMKSLRELDKVAFVRFASVYRDFKDVDQFMATLKGLLETSRES